MCLLQFLNHVQMFISLIIADGMDDFLFISMSQIFFRQNVFQWKLVETIKMNNTSDTIYQVRIQFKVNDTL